MNTDDPMLIQELRRDEGVRYEPYLDTVKVWTIGVGHNMQISPLPKDWTIPLTDAQVNTLLAKDLTMVFSDLDRKLPWWRSLSYARQRVMANMCFNLGINGLGTFVNTLALIHTGRYKDAATGMLASKWARQVGDRAKRLSIMMEQG
jgi:lysozyme